MSRERVQAIIDKRLFRPVFQPIVDLGQAQIAGFETLTRLSPEAGFEHTGELFDAAAEAGLTWELELATRRASIEAARHWPPGQLLFLNAAPSTIADPRFAADLAQQIASADGLAPGRVVVEITERSEQQYMDGLSDQAQRLAEHGFNLAIDDVGAGTSGLNRILLLRPQWLKLDRDLVDGVHADPVRQNLVRFILHFATLSGVRLIAEGIECRDDLERLIDLGVRYGQGFLLGRPGDQNQQLDTELVAWMRSIARGSAANGRRSTEVTIDRIVSEPARVPGSKTIGETAAALVADPDRTGVLVEEGHRFLGWADRDTILRLAGGSQASGPVSAITSPRRFVVQPRETVVHALETAALAAATGNQPLIVASDDRADGIVRIADLLRLASDVCGGKLTRAAPVTGLPGRVRCEEHLTRLFEQCAGDPESGWDAGFIDLDGLAAYNRAYGFEHGDNLIRDLAASIQAALAPAGEHAGWFVGHVGDDRFLVTAPRAVLEEFAEQIIDRFTRRASCTIAATTVTEGSPIALNPTRVGVRVLILPRAFDLMAGPDDLLQAERVLRRIAKEQAAAAPGSPGTVVVLADESDADDVNARAA